VARRGGVGWWRTVPPVQLYGPVEQEQSRLVIRLGLCDVGLAPTPPLRAVLGPVAGPATVVARVVSCRLGPIGGAALGAPSCSGLGTSFLPCADEQQLIRGSC